MGSETIPQASDNGGAWGFSKRDAARIAATVKRLEAQVYNRPAERARYPVGAPGGSLIPLSITSSVTAGSEANPSAFTAIVERPSGSNDGWTTTGGDTETCYNRAPGISFAASSSSPKAGWGISLQGVIYLVSADC